MTDLFLDVLNISFSAVWVVLAVVLARLVLRRAPRRLVCGLWALVALRLLFGGIEAPFSLIPSAELIPPESLFDQAPAIHSGISSIDSAVNPIYSEYLRPMPGASVNPLQVWLALFANLWVLGMIVMSIWAAVSWLRVRHQVRESIPDRGVYLCDRIESPFILGLFQPRIYLPSALAGDARDHVIAHERAHLSRRDHWWKPLGFALLTVNWFNPAIWLAYILLCRDIELACDERVIRKLSARDKKAYSSALLQCSLPRRAVTACPLAFGEVGVKQRVKSVLSYKKPAFWVIVLAVVLSLVLAVCFLTDPASRAAEIRWNGVLYIQEGDPVDSVPDKQQSTGTLRSVLHDSTPHPTEDGQAVGLGWEYAGQPIVQVGNALYLQEPGEKGWLPFRMQTGADRLEASINEDIWYHLTLHQGRLYSNEELTGAAADALTQQLLTLTQQQMTPGPGLDRQQYADDFDALITIDPEESGPWYELFRTNAQGWVCFVHDSGAGNSDWYFDGSGLDSFLLPYESELKQAEGGILLTEDTTLSLDFRTMEKDGFFLRAGIPCLEEGDSHIHWEFEPLEDAPGFRCRPMGRRDWMEVRFHDQEDPIYHHAFHSQQIAFATGVNGTLFDSGDSNMWGYILLDTTRGQLHITAPDNVFQRTDWSEEDFQTALIIPATLSLTEDGTSLLSSPAPSAYEADLGISMELNGISPTGATLVCTHDETDSQQIRTGSQWHLQQYRDGIWVDLLPEDAFWTAEAYPIPAGESLRFQLDWSTQVGELDTGRYRIVKSFFASEQASATQICCAEFTIENLGITLHAEDVTPDGLTLVCTQDGTPWGEILTGAPWSLEQWTGDGWVSVMPEDTVWTTIAYSVPQNQVTRWSISWRLIRSALEPGRYRVGKAFTCRRQHLVMAGGGMDPGLLGTDPVNQMYWAEFTIE